MIKRSDVQMIKRSDVQMIRWSKDQTFRWSGGQTIRSSDDQMIKQSKVQMIRWSNNQKFRWSDDQTIRLSNDQMIRLSDDQTIIWVGTNTQHHYCSHPSIYYLLTTWPPLGYRTLVPTLISQATATTFPRWTKPYYSTSLYIGPGSGLILSRECLSHDTTYFRMSARKFGSMLWRGSNIRVKVIGRYPDQ